MTSMNLKLTLQQVSIFPCDFTSHATTEQDPDIKKKIKAAMIAEDSSSMLTPAQLKGIKKHASKDDKDKVSFVLRIL